MSVVETDVFIERMWEEYREQYLAECNANNWQADGKDFLLWLEEKDLIPASVDYE